ncbi:unnamed protein product [Oncorhynchus mykiss]|uniref:Histone deacetylase complex subunit SAP130 C-terminal domain-containing protein n=1 Tax=Oncorhynchus mykiss TaxID=8022 RepID=A0A060YP62_ONCMY|nr:unnamed protein product [Oncorhynchus mykiss]
MSAPPLSSPQCPSPRRTQASSPSPARPGPFTGPPPQGTWFLVPPPGRSPANSSTSFPQKRLKWWRPTVQMRTGLWATGPWAAGLRGESPLPENMWMRKGCVTSLSGRAHLSLCCVTIGTPGRQPITTSRGTATSGSKSNLEHDVYSRLTSLQEGLIPKKRAGVDDELHRINELIQGNIQRCKLVMDQVTEARDTMMKVLDHKDKVLKLLNQNGAVKKSNQLKRKDRA